MKIAKPTHSYEPLETALLGGLVTGVIVESIRLRVYDLLETPHTVDELAVALGTDRVATQTLLDLLVCRGLIDRHCGTYTNTPLASEFLVSTSPFYQGQAIELHQASYDYVTSNLPDLLKQPGQARCQIRRKFASDKALEGVAQHAMRGSLQDAVEFIAALPGFTVMRRMCDVGGNHGRYATALLDRNPMLSAQLVDLPNVVDVVKAYCRDAENADRLTVLPIDLKTDTLPRNDYDLVLVSHVLQIFRDTLDETIQRIAASVAPGGWFVSHHMNPDGGAAPGTKATLDFMYHAMAKVDHFIHRDELERALKRAGFTRFIPGSTGPGDINLILAAQKN